MKIMRVTEKLGRIGKKQNEKPNLISIGEGYSLWTALSARYDSLITTKTLLKFTKDEDLKLIINRGIKLLESQRKILEDLCKQYAVPLPARPPEDCTIPVDTNTISDRYVFREIYNGMSNMMFKHITNYQRAHCSDLRETFKRLMDEEMDLYDNFYEYGKLKTYLLEPPSFKP